MKRRSTPESIQNTIKRLRQMMPDIHIRTTLITGFPGETAADYDTLLDFILHTRFERLGVFAYSKEEGTPAGEMKGQIAERVKKDRRDGIMLRQMEISRQLNQKKIGQTLEVIVDELDSQLADPNSETTFLTYIGRTQYDAPEIDHTVLIQTQKSHKPGDLIQVLITDGFDYDIVGLV
jgi:ribosomal protein S12 methylthiotransferase